MASHFRPLLLAMAAMAIGSAAQAGPIVAPISATVNVGTYFVTTPANLINQSGLSAGYTSGVTDFDTYIASSPTHDSQIAQNDWVSVTGATAANMTFDFGASISVESFVIWNRAVISQGVKDFELRACPDSACTTTTLLGSFTAANNLGTDTAVGAEVFSFSATTTRYLRWDMLNGYNGSSLNVGEVAFEQSVAVTDTPEPASALLLAGGLLALTARRRYGAG